MWSRGQRRVQGGPSGSEEWPREAALIERLGSWVGQDTEGGERKMVSSPPAQAAGQGRALMEEGTGEPQRPGQGPGGPHS